MVRAQPQGQPCPAPVAVPYTSSETQTHVPESPCLD